MWSARGLNSEPMTLPRLCFPSILRGLPVWLEVGGTVETAMGVCGLKLTDWRTLRATRCHDAEQLGDSKPDLFRVYYRMSVCEHACVYEYIFSCQILLDNWNFQLTNTPSA